MAQYDNLVSVQLAYVGGAIVAARPYRDHDGDHDWPEGVAENPNFETVYARVPHELAAKLYKQGTAHQVFEDGFDAALEAAPHVCRIDFLDW